MAGLGTPSQPGGSGGGVGTTVSVSNFPNPQPVSGSVTANQGTSPWVDNITQIGGSALSLGQQLAAASLPVVLTAAQITTLTPPSNTGYALDASLSTIDSDLKSNITLHAGSNLIGKVGIDQTTPGTTNATSLAQINAATTLAGNGTTGTGSIRVTPASDSTGIANYGHGATAASVPSGATYKGVRGSTALPTAVSDGQLVGAMGDKFGRQVVIPNGMRDIVLPMTQLTLTGTTTETSLITAVASTFNDLLSVVVINTSATATQVDFRDSTAGTIRLSLYVPAGDTRGVVFNTPLPQAAVNTAWTAKCGTSVSSVIITGSYIANK